MAGWAVVLTDGCDVDTAEVGIGATAESEGAKPPHANIGSNRTRVKMIRGENVFRLTAQATG